MLIKTKNKTLRTLLSVAALVMVVCSVPASAATYFVKNTNDIGLGTLRYAIKRANTNPGFDTIFFNIPGDGVHTIAPASALPEITDPVHINGYSQPDSKPNTLRDGDDAVLLIELSGASVPKGSNGLFITAGQSVVRGLIINNFASRITPTPGGGTSFTPGSGIHIGGKGGNNIEGCFIGTDSTGSVAAANGYGVSINSSPNNTVGNLDVRSRNIISGNEQAGVYIFDYSKQGGGNRVRGNYIGTDANGQNALGNAYADQFQSAGVLIQHGSNTIVGGTLAEERNIISGNSTGVLVYGDQFSVASGHKIEGNYIGVDVTGTRAIANQTGIHMASEGMNNTIGGSTVGARNLISGNEIGIALGNSTSNTRVKVQGNYIGTDVTGAAPLGNRFGIHITLASTNRIGGVEPGAANLIAFNERGIVIGGTSGGGTSNAILSNSIHSNSQFGIDLGDFGPTPNDAGDADTGGNNLQNYPGLYSASSSSTNSTLSIRGLLRSAPDTAYRIEFFASPSCDPSGYGQGKTFLGARRVTTGAEGKAPFLVTLPVFVAAGQVITATATDPNGNTSEFSNCVSVTDAPSTTVARAESAGANG